MKKEAIIKKLNNIEGVLELIILNEKLPLDTLKEGQSITLLKCSSREFDIRWWSFGFTCLVLGLIAGIIIGMHI